MSASGKAARSMEERSRGERERDEAELKGDLIC